jgi:amino acid adenylation domain-containing protein
MSMQEEIASGFRLSPQQQRLWRLGGGRPGAAFRAECALRLEGELDRPALERALAAVVARNEILRTAFPLLPGMSLPLQVILDPAPPAVATVAGAAGAASEEGLADLLAAHGRAPFDLERGEVLRAALVALGPREHLLLLALPALCADAATVENLGLEVARAYAAECREAAPADAEAPMQYADVTEWQHQLLESTDTAEGVGRWRDYWREREIAAQLAAPQPFAEGAGGEEAAFAPATLPLRLDPGLAAALERLLADWESPAPAFFLACWQIVLWRSTGRADVLVGVLHDGRRYEELRDALGPLARYLPIHCRLDAALLPRQVVALARAADDEAARRQEHFAWDHVAGRNGDAAEPFFPVCFDGSERPWEHAAAGLRLSLAHRHGLVDRYELELAASRRPGEPRLALRYDPRRVRGATAERLGERLVTLLASLVERPDAPIGELAVVGAGERQLLLVDFNRAPAGAAPGCLHRRFEAQAARTPERPAVVSAEERLTYADLNGRANRLAHHLRALGIGVETRVAICLERSTAMVVAVLAVLKAGGAYVPLDPAQPAERLAFLLDDCGAAAVLTQERLAGLFPAAGVRVLRLDAAEEVTAIAGRPAANPGGVALPESLAYVIYTSGSTGRPKGVLVEHRSPVNLLAGLEAAVYAHHGEAPLAASLNAPLFFDASMQQLVLLLAGHTLHVVPEAVRTDGEALLAFLAAGALDAFDCTPTQLRLLLAAGLLAAPGRGPRLFLIAGEAIDEPMWEALRTATGTAFYDIYGPTECTVDATAHRIGAEAAGTGPTIGRPLAGYAVHLLDAGLRLVPAGAPGEICVGGAGLARGYAARPATTAERFVPHPFAARPGERLYRTGDLGRQRPDGSLEFLGRVDHQIKVRGYRIEPGEIEAALAAHPYVREAVVAARQDGPGQTLLAAYVVPTAEAPPGLAGAHGELQRFLLDRLPAYMVPAAFVAIPALPLTASGKVDRRALPAPPAGRPDLSAEPVAPRTPREQALAEVWAQVLGVERLGIDDSFFALGGDSIRSLQVQSLARERGLNFSVQELFQHQTVRELAAALPAGGGAAGEQQSAPFSLVAAEDRARIPAEVEDAYPLGMLQAGMVFHTEMSPESGIYQDIFSFSMRAKLDLPALAAAAARLVARHPVLRTSFDLANYREPLQFVHRSAHIPIELEDVRHLPVEEQERLIGEYLESDSRRPFDWQRPPLVRIRVHLQSDERFQLTLTEHHAILDGWSVASILTELFNAYSKLATGEEPPLAAPPPNSFREFVALERQALASAECRGYWLRALGDGVRTPLPRWPGAAGDGAPLRHEIVEILLPAATADRLRELARAASVPLKSVLLAAHLKVLGLLSGATDVVTGLSSDARPEESGADQALGIFVSMLPFRQRLAGGTWFDLARSTFDAERAMLPHRRFPLAETQRLLGGEPLFEAAFNFVHFHVYQGVERVSGVEVEGRSGFELLNLPLTANFFVDPFSSHVGIGLNCHLNVLAKEQIEAIAGYYARTLEAMAADPHAHYDARSLLAEEERRWLAVAANQPVPPLPAAVAAGGHRLHELFAAQVDRTPEAVAVVFEGRRLTYRELDAAANRLAHRLRALGVGPESLVGVAMERSAELVVALLGVLKAGGAYVPLDVTYPRDRLAHMLADSGVQVLLGQRRLAGLLPEHGARLLCLDDPAAGLEGESAAPPVVAVAGANAAYMIYTSGSTGRPKGAVNTHTGICNRLLWLQAARAIGAGDRVLQKTPFSFDVSIWEFFWPLTTGAALVVARPGGHQDPAYLAELIAGERVTVLHFVPSMLQLFLDEPGLSRCASVRRVIASGEALPFELQQRFFAAFGTDIELYNLYGPTEAAVEVTFWQCRSEDPGPRVPIGRAVTNTRLHLLDPLLQEVPVGVPGELAIGGVQVARGYHGRPELTAERFVPDPSAGLRGEPGARLYRTGDLARRLPDGVVEYLGRLDFQVKIRGLRIELGEIEALLAAQPGVRQAVVTAAGAGAERRLVAYVVPAAGAAPSPAALRQALRERLPEAMVPAACVLLAALPLTPSGKLDRRALPDPELLRGESRQAFVAPRNPTEELLAALWSEVLGVERVGIHDNFLELGGHSLTAIRLISRLRSAFAVSLPLRILYDAHTVAELALAVVKAQAEQAEGAALERMLAELETISDEEARSLLARGRTHEESER